MAKATITLTYNEFSELCNDAMEDFARFILPTNEMEERHDEFLKKYYGEFADKVLMNLEERIMARFVGYDLPFLFEGVDIEELHPPKQ